MLRVQRASGTEGARTPGADGRVCRGQRGYQKAQPAGSLDPRAARHRPIARRAAGSHSRCVYSEPPVSTPVGGTMGSMPSIASASAGSTPALSSRTHRPSVVTLIGVCRLM
jgi:hypothetical protein